MAKAAKTATAEWTWRTGGPKPKVEADVFATELEKLAGDHPLDLVAPDAIWQSARKKSSPIHELFNWNVQEAAEAHWRDHARYLVGRLTPVHVLVEDGPNTSRRGWWSVVVAKERGYTSEDRVLSDRDLRLQVIATVKSELHRTLAKYLTVLNFGNIVPRLNAIVADIQGEIDRLEMEATRPVRRKSGRLQPGAHQSAE